MRRRGFTMVELTTGLSVMMFVVLGSLSLLAYGVRFYGKTYSKTNLNTGNEQGLRRIIETLRSATSVAINSDGTVITYTLPKLNTTNDAVTGEKELADPVVSDGVVRTFTVNFTTGKVTDSSSGRVIVKNVTRTDPEPTSSQYNQQYVPFQMTSIGSIKGVTVNLITLEKTSSGTNYLRLKTTTVVRNSP